MRYEEGTLIREKDPPTQTDTLLLLITGVDKKPKKARSSYEYERIFFKRHRDEKVGYRPQSTLDMSSLHDWADDNEVVTIDEVRPEIREMAEKKGWV